MRKARGIRYGQSGVNYEMIDPLKVAAQAAGKKTAENLKSLGLTEVSGSRGEAAYVVDLGNIYLAAVEECLGTKPIVAEAMRKPGGKTYYDYLAQDTVGMMVNDLVTVGARPAVVLAYWASGGDTWFKDKKRSRDLVTGWKRACDLSGAAWGGGETPALNGIVRKNAVDLAGCSWGLIKPKSRLILGDKLAAGDKIIVLESSGIHANGVSLARKIAGSLPKKYATPMADGRSFGEGLLAPTIIYAPLIKALLTQNVDIHYLINITGHGWRKLMRANKQLTYRITAVPPVPEVLQFMVKAGPVSLTEAYSTLNMGAGMAIYAPSGETGKILNIAGQQRFKAYEVGVVETGPKRVIIEPLGIEYGGRSLQVRD